MLPCIKDKCIKLPICKSRETIDCTLLNNYVHDKLPQSKNNSFVNDTVKHLYKKSRLWLEINETLPNLEQVFPDKDLSYPSHLRARHMRSKHKSKELYQI